MLAPAYDYVARFQGGNNAGHTVVVGDKTYKFNLMPSGAVQGRKVVIGNGVVVDPRILVKEIDQLTAQGRKVDLVVSERAHVIMPYHLALDGAAEEGRGGARKIGTTKRGIGPCYADKAARLGVRMLDFVDPERFRARLDEVFPIKWREMNAWEISDPPKRDAILAEYEPLAARLREYVGDAGALLDSSLQKRKKVLLEGAQGILLDIDHGTYPYVTSSSTVGMAPGAGIGGHHIAAVLGVAKAYATRVGEGPFPTELPSTEGVGNQLLTVGKEFGTVTGRARRVGWLDIPALKYAIRVGGITHLALTKLDVLSGVEKVQVATKYDGSTTFPTDERKVAALKPVYRSFKGWKETAIKSGRSWRLSKEAGAFVKAVEKLVGVPIVLASVGPARDATLTLRKHPFGGA